MLVFHSEDTPTCQMIIRWFVNIITPGINVLKIVEKNLGTTYDYFLAIVPCYKNPEAFYASLL